MTRVSARKWRNLNHICKADLRSMVHKGEEELVLQVYYLDGVTELFFNSEMEVVIAHLNYMAEEKEWRK